eukprot:1146305-Pelagomonas_calceolata.AAC.9
MEGSSSAPPHLLSSQRHVLERPVLYITLSFYPASFSCATCPNCKLPHTHPRDHILSPQMSLGALDLQPCVLGSARRDRRSRPARQCAVAIAVRRSHHSLWIPSQFVDPITIRRSHHSPWIPSQFVGAPCNQQINHSASEAESPWLFPWKCSTVLLMQRHQWFF